MASAFSPQLAIDVLRDVIVSMVRRDGPPLSSHQFGVFLTCYLKDGDHTVRGLAAELGVSKSVITRALDKLAELELAERKIDPADRRSVIVQRTKAGMTMITELQSIAAETAKIVRPAVAAE